MPPNARVHRRASRSEPRPSGTRCWVSWHCERFSSGGFLKAQDRQHDIALSRTQPCDLNKESVAWIGRSCFKLKPHVRARIGKLLNAPGGHLLPGRARLLAVTRKRTLNTSRVNAPSVGTPVLNAGRLKGIAAGKCLECNANYKRRHSRS